MEHYGQTEQDCSKVVSDLHLDSFSRCCCTRGTWKALAPHLEMERAVVDDIDRRQVDEEEKRSMFFYQWKQMTGSDATYTRLVAALLKIKHRLDAEKLLKMLQGSNSSSSKQHPSRATSSTTPGTYSTLLRYTPSWLTYYSSNSIQYFLLSATRNIFSYPR